MNYNDGKPRVIEVSIHLDGVWVPCGRIMFNSSVNVGAFEYKPDYKGPVLDPINLNYKRAGVRRFMVNARINPDLLHRVFTDYLPGPWGVQVLQAEFPQIKSMKAAEKLHWFGSRTIGALAFSVNQPTDETPIQGIDLLEQIRRRSLDFLASRIDAIGMGKTVIDGLSSHGGARPKCMFEDRNGGQWLTKFNVNSDAYNYARVEHASSHLARLCGIETVQTRCLELDPGSDVLFVRRYDRVGDSRPHRVSAFSLMNENLVRGQHEGDYKMIFDVLADIACDPISQRDEMMRRMLFNIAINNTDDHLKNFELILDEKRNCWKLSPAYDLTVDPYANPRITSVFGNKRSDLSNDAILHIAKVLDMDPDRALALRDQVIKGVAQWKRVFAACEVSEVHMAKLEKAMEFGSRMDNKAGAQPVLTPRPGAAEKNGALGPIR
jgi:serine/threonine-protein kinase HipA